ncbi:MAG: DNA polymerase III subunit gamma/tau [Marinilabiliaceae bacterium]|nr:DNA polymerase III subunit gamma/tau [Marinilabiliaceae bacterium]
MDYIVSARKYRPATFESVVGQQSVTKTLINAIRSNQVASAYLFCGPRGVGKTTCARIFAKTINCMNLNEAYEPCDECDSCKAFNIGQSFNIHELDAASNNGVEDIRDLISKTLIPPPVGKYSVYIVDEVHMLSAGAFNAFLKTLEEPPSHVKFILATTEKHKIIPTIISRCQVFDFSRIGVSDVADYLKYIAQKENIVTEDDALSIIAQKADGGMRDALSIFDQIVAFSDSQVTYKNVVQNLNVLDYDIFFAVVDNLIQHDYIKAMLILNDVIRRGFDPLNFLSGLTHHIRNLLVAHDAASLSLLDVSEQTAQRYQEQSKALTPNQIIDLIEIFAHYETEYKAARDKRQHVEFALLKAAMLGDEKKKSMSN